MTGLRKLWKRVAAVVGVVVVGVTFLAPEMAHGSDIKVSVRAGTHGGTYHPPRHNDNRIKADGYFRMPKAETYTSRGGNRTISVNLFGMGTGGYDTTIRDGRRVEREGVRYDRDGNAYGFRSEGYEPRRDRSRHHEQTELRETPNGRPYCTNGGTLTVEGSRFGEYFNCRLN